MKASPEAVMTYTEIATALLCSWPLSKEASLLKKIIWEMKWWFLSFMTLVTLTCNFYTMYLSRDNLLEVTKFLCYIASDAQVSIKMFICKRNYRVLQNLIEEIKSFLKTSKIDERELLIDCIDEASPIHLYINLSGIFAGVFMTIGPFITNDSAQEEVKFPFPTDNYYVRGIMYIQQSIVILQVASISVLDGQMCLFIWFTTGRFKMLGKELMNITQTDEFNNCIKVHQHLLRYLDDVCKLARPVVVTTIIAATITVIFGGIHIVGNEPFNLRMQFVTFLIAFGLQLFISASAAENLIQAADDLKWSFYKCNWMDSSKDLIRTAVIFIQRLNKLPEISVTGIMPQLSLNYYATFLSKTFSFFTTLRVIISQMELDKVELSDSEL